VNSFVEQARTLQWESMDGFYEISLVYKDGKIIIENAFESYLGGWQRAGGYSFRTVPLTPKAPIKHKANCTREEFFKNPDWNKPVCYC